MFNLCVFKSNLDAFWKLDLELIVSKVNSLCEDQFDFDFNEDLMDLSLKLIL